MDGGESALAEHVGAGLIGEDVERDVLQAFGSDVRDEVRDGRLVGGRALFGEDEGEEVESGVASHGAMVLLPCHQV